MIFDLLHAGKRMFPGAQVSAWKSSQLRPVPQLVAAARMTAEHQAGVEKAAALVTSVFLYGTQNRTGPAPRQGQDRARRLTEAENGRLAGSVKLAGGRLARSVGGVPCHGQASARSG